MRHFNSFLCQVNLTQILGQWVRPYTGHDPNQYYDQIPRITKIRCRMVLLEGVSKQLVFSF